jgi:hypothetical protein
VKEEVEMYSGIIHLDFDKLTDEQMANAKLILSKNPYTHVFFVSPSGHGIKLFVEVTSGIEDHTIAYLQVQAHYEKLTGLKADPSCKDITRLCFVSYDTKVYTNTKNKKFVVKGVEERLEGERVRGLGERLEGERVRGLARPLPTNPLTTNHLTTNLLTSPKGSIFNQQILFTNRIKTYEEGSRNAYIYQLALNCKRAGIPRQAALDLMAARFDLPYKEMETTVKSGYKRSLEGLGSLEDGEKVRGLDDGEMVRGLDDGEMVRGLEGETELSKPLNPSTPKLSSHPLTPPEDEEPTREIMPTLPDAIFDTMPQFLQKATNVAGTNEERDILLLGSLTTLSVALHQLTGKYNDNPVNANLFLFVSAVASAGKGILIHCRKLVVAIHNRLREQARLLKQRYEAELIEYRNNKDKDATLEQPRKPPIMMLFIPGNNSATGFLEILFDSFKRGIIFETEGDTLSNAFNSDYGDFSDALRNSFQHEPISYYRRTDKEYVEIDRPSLSVVLSGTPKQVKVLIPNTENGLFSRFMFYVMNMNYEWKNVFASRTENGLDKHFEQLGQQFYTFYQHLESLPPMTFTLSDDQQERFNVFFQRIQNLYIAIQEDDIVSCVRRLGLMAYRVMMIFSALRLMESGEHTARVVCEEVDFDNALEMISVLVKHSSHVFTQVSEDVQKEKPKHRKEIFLEQLPAEFNRQTFLEIGMKLRIPNSTAARYIKKFIEAGIIVNSLHDHYIKLEISKNG